MAYLNSKDVTAIAASAAIWATLNAWISPLFWNLTHLPFFCDILSFTALIIVVWWTRKIGVASLTGLIVTILTLVLRPGAFHMVGFLAASIVFDLTTRAVGYENIFKQKGKGRILVFFISIISSAIAGLIIGSFFMNLTAISAILTFASLHTVGGIIGAIIGIILVSALMVREVKPI